jgi:hypothetical protein
VEKRGTTLHFPMHSFVSLTCDMRFYRQRIS